MATYSFLKADIINTMENDSTEFSDQIPYFVDKAEIRLTKDLDDAGLNNYASFTFTASSPVVSLPAKTRIVRNVNFTTSASLLGERDGIIPLLQRSYEFVLDYWSIPTSVGRPKYYSRKDNSSIYIVPTPTSALSGEIAYVRRPLALASATGTSVTTANYYSEFCYNALFYACMIEATRYSKNWETVQAWQGDYVNAVEGLRNQARRTRQDDMESANSPVGSPNPLQKGSN